MRRRRNVASGCHFVGIATPLPHLSLMSSVPYLTGQGESLALGIGHTFCSFRQKCRRNTRNTVRRWDISRKAKILNLFIFPFLFPTLQSNILRNFCQAIFRHH